MLATEIDKAGPSKCPGLWYTVTVQTSTDETRTRPGRRERHACLSGSLSQHDRRASQCCLPTTVIQGTLLRNDVNQTIVGMGSASGVNMNLSKIPWENWQVVFGDGRRERHVIMPTKHLQGLRSFQEHLIALYRLHGET